MYDTMDYIIMFLVMFVPFLLCITALAAIADFILYREYKRKQSLMAERIKK